MVANKLRAIWKILTAHQYMVIYDDGTDGTAIGGGRTADLRDVMFLAIQIKHTYNSMIDMIEGSAVELGEAKALQEMRDAIKKLEKQSGRQ